MFKEYYKANTIYITVNSGTFGPKKDWINLTFIARIWTYALKKKIQNRKILISSVILWLT